ncbi:MAG: hypothetical protein ACYC0V_04040 [Armatimonadota bacterium]
MRYCISIMLLLSASVVFAASNKDTEKVFILKPDMPSVKANIAASIYPPPPDADIMKADAGIDPEQPYRWIHSPGESFRISLRCGDKNVSNCILTVWDWDFRPVIQTEYTVPFTSNVTFKSKGRGTYIITLDGMQDKKCIWRLPRSFAVCPSNVNKRKYWDNNEFWIGQVTIPGMQWLPIGEGRFVHPSGLTEEQSADLDAELVARMGVPIARPYMLVTRLDPDGLNLDFSKPDKWVKLYVSHGFKLDIQLGFPVGEGIGPVLPQYDGRFPLMTPIKEPAFRYFASEMTKRYSRYAKFMQIGNEPDNLGMFPGTPDDFIGMMVQAHSEIRKLDKKIPITNGGFCQVDISKTEAIIPKIKGLSDFVSYHCHGYLSDLKKEFKRIQEFHNKAGYESTKYAITEMGCYTSAVSTEGIGAYTEMQKLLYAWSHGNKGVMLYSSRELGWPRQHNSEFGFVDHFFCPRFVYGTVSAFLDVYAGIKFDSILKESDNLHVYIFKGNGKTMAAFFTSKEPQEISLTGTTQCLYRIDPMGNKMKVRDTDRIILKTSNYPQTLVFDGDCDVSLQ